ncbi:tape measure protein [Acinetobacter bereziniae]|uniref:tape measure protein n=3 Tax=Acinetobacter bereziniae TaxID=106648 RepID=UPI001905D9A1|nr:tape measure protein [Acinetobacter bereziniae]MDG3557076.1 tape measure protein [Acinetobacter bereziniae]QQC81760.1 tape measure protein [Acinetobacter bereziniae]UUN94874.1 tape measure protein [Acinetobacter bereziniae]
MASGSLDFRLNLLANTAGLQQGMNGAKFAVNALVAAMAAVGVGLSVQGLAQAADSYTNLSARINIATKDGGDFNQAMAGVHQVALATNSNLTTTADLFTRLNAVGKDMGMTQQQALDLTKTVTQAIKIGGGSAEAADGAVTQFIQAMQGGVLRGEEFNSIMEGGYGLAEALARGLGVTTGELRKMAEAGELSSERVAKALQSQSASVQATYDKFPLTIGNALQRISTSWEILIGKMDQANGASSAVAQWLKLLADNIQELDIILNDVGEGFVWLGDQLKKIDPATIETLKIALISAYDALKELASTTGTAFEAAFDAINTVLGQIFSFNSGVDTANDKTNGFTKTLQAINVVIGALSDGFSAIGIGINLFVGALYSVGSAWSNLVSKFTWGDVKQEAIANMRAMQAKSEEYYQKASDGAMQFKSKAIAAYEDIGKTQEQKNADSIANNQLTIDQLIAQEVKHTADYKAISDQRVLLEQQLFEARKTGNQAAIDAALASLAELDVKEKEYQAESKKITDEKIKAAQEVANAQINSATLGGAALSEQTKKIIESQVAAQGLAVEFDKTGKAIVTAIATSSAQVAITTQKLIDDTRKAASTLGLDLDAYSNKLSAKFGETQTIVSNLSKGLEVSGIAGQEAGELIFQGWQKWLEQAKNTADLEAAKNKLKEFGETGQLSTAQVAQGIAEIKARTVELDPHFASASLSAKNLGIDLSASLNQVSPDFLKLQGELTATSANLTALGATGEQAAIVTMTGWRKLLEAANSQAEIEAAKVKLKEFGDIGVLSTRQVEQGLIDIKNQAQQLPATIDPVTESFKRLGIETKENLKIAAQQAMMDFINVRDSGKATAEGVQKAYEKAAQAAALSGNTSVIAMANAVGAGRNLEIQIDSTGKATVEATNKMETSMQRVSNATYGAQQSFRDLGDVAREEALSSSEAWAKALDSQQGGMHSTTQGEKTRLAFNQSEVEAELKAMGYDDKKAAEIAKNILQGSKLGDGYRNASTSWLAKNGLDVVGSFAGGGGGTSNANYVREQLEKYTQYAGNSSSTIGIGDSSKTVKYEISTGKNKATVYGSPSTETNLNSILSELETIKKST